MCVMEAKSTGVPCWTKMSKVDHYFYLAGQRRLKIKQGREIFEWQWGKWGKEKEKLTEKGMGAKRRDVNYRRWRGDGALGTSYSSGILWACTFMKNNFKRSSLFWA